MPWYELSYVSKRPRHSQNDSIQGRPILKSKKQTCCAYTVAPLLTHWGRVTHICVSKQTIIGSDNGLSPDRRQAIIWTNAGLLSIGPLRVYFSENLTKIQQFSLKKMHVKMSSAKWRSSCLGLNVLTHLLPLSEGPQLRGGLYRGIQWLWFI